MFIYITRTQNRKHEGLLDVPAQSPPQTRSRWDRFEGALRQETLEVLLARYGGWFHRLLSAMLGWFCCLLSATLLPSLASRTPPPSTRNPNP